MLITTPRYLCFKKTLFSHTLCLSVTFVLILSTLIKKTIMKNYGNVLTSLCRLSDVFYWCNAPFLPYTLFLIIISNNYPYKKGYHRQRSTAYSRITKESSGLVLKWDWIVLISMNLKLLYDSYSPNSLPDNDICFLKEDSLLNLWIGTQEGLAIYNRGEDNFTLIYHNNAPVQAKTACLLTDGILFAGTGLWIYSYADRQLHSLPIINKGKAINDYFKYIKPWKKIRMW